MRFTRRYNWRGIKFDKATIEVKLTENEVNFNIIRKYRDGFVIIRSNPTDPSGIEAWISRLENALPELYVADFKKDSQPFRFKATIYVDESK